MKRIAQCIVSLGLRALLAGASVSVFAQAYPAKLIRLVVPYAVGGPTDIVARSVAQGLSESLKQTVIVENKPGAGGMIGAEFVAKSANDGYTLLLSGSGAVAVNQSLFKKFPYDTMRDFAPITIVVSAPTIFLVPPSLGVNSVAEFIALAKNKPGQLNYASAGNGTPPHLAAELLKSQAGIDLLHVPYTARQATNAVMTGEAALLFGTPADFGLVKAGKVKALAVTNPKRFPPAPDLPTMQEAGLPGFVVTAWYALLAPARTPEEIVHRLQQETARMLASPEMGKRLLGLGFEPIGNTPEQTGVFIQSEIIKWAKVIKDSGAKPE